MSSVLNLLRHRGHEGIRLLMVAGECAEQFDSSTARVIVALYSLQQMPQCTFELRKSELISCAQESRRLHASARQ